MSCRRSGEKSIRVKANDLKRLFNTGVFVSMVYLGASDLNISKEKCVHGPAERKFNVVTHEVTFEKFECNYRCMINSMNSVFMAGNAIGPRTELPDSMYQMPMGALIQTFPNNKYTQQKKKRTTTIFPLRSPYNTKMLIVMKYSFLIKFY